MGEYKDVLSTKELKTLEIDIEKNIFKINGDDMKRCRKIDIAIAPNERTVTVVADATVIFENKKR